MRCDRCGEVGRGHGAGKVCAVCQATSPVRSLAARPGPGAAWLWTSPTARQALASKHLGVILKAFRSATGASQREVARALGYDPTYVSMIESGRRQITDVASRRHFSRYLGLPAHVLGVTTADDADFAAMLEFGASAVRLAVVAREAGRAADAINELWPLTARLEERLERGDADVASLCLLSRARAELGVALGDLLPEERLATAARWTSRALLLARALDDVELHAFALRVHGNELRKAGHHGAALARLGHAMALAPTAAERAACAVQLARAAGGIGDADTFDRVMRDAWELTDKNGSSARVTPFVLREVELRGLLSTGRLALASKLVRVQQPDMGLCPPQWRAIERTTVGTVLLASGEPEGARDVFHQALTAAELLRLPHQIQRAMRAGRRRLDDVTQRGEESLARLSRRLGPEAQQPASERPQDAPYQQT